MGTDARFSRFRTAIVGVLVTLVAALAPGVASAAPGDIGFEDFGYAPIGGSPTGSKPESKLWFNDGIWWASMFDPVSQNHMIFRLNRQTQKWTKTNTTIDTRDSTRVDMLWDGTKLYAASHGFTTSASSSTSSNGRLWRYSYDAAKDEYTLDTGAGFTASGVRINTVRSETLTIDQDSAGRLWATWVVGGQVQVAATNGNDTQWGAPVTIGTGVTSDDISSLIAFDPGATNGGPQIGVMWSNQTDHRFWFATHRDATAAGSGWVAGSVPNTQSSDDHINLKTRGGTVYAAVKHSTSGTLPLTSLLVRGPAPNGSPASGWSTPRTFGTARDSHTRPIVQLDGGGVHMFATGPQPPATSGQSGGDIVEKSSSSFTNPTFSTGVGTAVIRDNGSPDMNDVTSTKQNATAESGIVIMANNATTKTYWHADLDATGTTPNAPVASFTTNPVDTTGNAPFAVSFTDTSTGGAAASRTWDFGDGTPVVTGANATTTISHTYSATGQFTAVLTVSNADGSSSASKIVVVNANAPKLTASFTSTKRADGFTFDFAGTATNGSPSTTFSWDFGDGATSTAQNPTHTYTTAGTFDVSLTVRDGANSDTATQQVTAGTAAPGTATFSPAADTQVKDTSPNTNYGTLTTVRVRNGTTASPTTYWTFLRFDVTGVGTVSNAKLRLFVTDDSVDGGTVYSIPNTPAWTETTLTWATRPVTTLPAGIKAAGAVPLGWIEIDLGTAVPGNGTYNFVLASASTNSAIYSSREGTNPPQLVLTTS